jgi:4-amino-4-deoxy-L-arabinose transferase-like glycosyltransferase
MLDHEQCAWLAQLRGPALALERALTAGARCSYHVPPQKSLQAPGLAIMPRLTAYPATWICILTIAIGVRLALGVWWQGRLGPEKQFFFGDSHTYWVLGQAIARGDPFEYESPDRRVFRTPGYPLMLAGLFRVFGDDMPVMVARALSALLGGLAVAIIGWWCTLLFDARAGTIAGWMAALYPGAVSMGAFVLSESPFCPFMLLQLVCWTLAWRSASSRRSISWAAAGGVAGALATLIRPSWLLFTPFAIAVALVFDSHRRREWVICIAMGVGLLATMLPWWIRNAQVTGRFVATTLQSGAGLYDGLSPLADGSSNMTFVPELTAAERAVDAGPTGDTFEYRLDRRMHDAAVAWAKANPGRVAELAWIKFVRIWNVWPNEPSFRSWPLRLAVFFTYTPLLILGLVGVWRFSPRGWPYVLAWLPALYLTLLHMVFVGSIRYREPAMLALIVLAAGVLAGYRRPTVGPSEAPA